MKETQKVIDQLNSKDKEIFYCDMRPNEFSWEKYTIILWRGVRQYIMKEKLNEKISFWTYIRLCIVHYGFILVLILILFNCILRSIS